MATTANGRNLPIKQDKRWQNFPWINFASFIDFGMIGRKMTKLAVLRTGKTCKQEVRHIAYLVNTGQDI